jgi:DNA-binding PadR family transcriptional regulator
MLRRHKQRDALQGTLDLLVLKTLSRGPHHGYGIAADIQSISDDILRIDEEQVTWDRLTKAVGNVLRFA